MKNFRLSKTILWLIITMILLFGFDSNVLAFQPSTEVCGQSGSMTVLFVGGDAYDKVGHWPYGSDLVRLVKADFDNQKISVMAFSRDLSIQLISGKKQNLGLKFHEEDIKAEGDTVKKVITATGVLTSEIFEELFGYQPDYYVAVELDKLNAMVDAIGGVEIDNPTKFTNENGYTFPAGVQTLDGERAAQYVRSWIPGYDDARFIRQNVFLEPLLKKVGSLEVLAKSLTLFIEFKDDVITDLNSEMFMSFACLAGKIDVEKITYDQVKINDITQMNPDGSSVVNRDVIAKYITSRLD